MKFVNISCVIIWAGWFVYSIYCMFAGIMIEPSVFACASLISAMYFLRELVYNSK